MSRVRLAALLPDDTDTNGLDPWAGKLRAEPTQQIVAIAYLDVTKLITDYDKGEVTPVVKVVAIEIVGQAADVPREVQQAFLDAHRRRTNKEPLPFEEDSESQPDRLAITDGVDVDAAYVEAGRIVEGEILPTADCDRCQHPAEWHVASIGECTGLIDEETRDCPCREYREPKP